MNILGYAGGVAIVLVAYWPTLTHQTYCRLKFFYGSEHIGLGYWMRLHTFSPQ